MKKRGIDRRAYRAVTTRRRSTDDSAWVEHLDAAERPHADLSKEAAASIEFLKTETRHRRSGSLLEQLQDIGMKPSPLIPNHPHHQRTISRTMKFLVATEEAEELEVDGSEMDSDPETVSPGSGIFSGMFSIFKGSPDERASLLESGENYGTQDQPPRRGRRRRIWINYFRRVFQPVVIQESIIDFLYTVVLCRILALVVLSAILYYGLGNPKFEFDGQVTYSWLLLFAARQIVTYNLARATEYLLIDCLAHRSSFISRFFGPLVTLVLIQCKDEELVVTPFLWCAWALWDILLLRGPDQFSGHWLYFTGIGIFTDQNPTGGFEENPYYTKLLVSIVIISVFVAVKRLLVSLAQGNGTFAMYKSRLDRLTECSAILSKLALLAEEGHDKPVNEEVPTEEPNEENEKAKLSPKERLKSAVGKLKVKPSEEDLFGQKEEIQDAEGPLVPNWMRFLESWTEPNQLNHEKPSLRILLDFRKAMKNLFGQYPFSNAFGPADTRKNCIESAQHVFVGLLRWTPREDYLPYATLLRIFESNSSMLGNMVEMEKQEDAEKKLLSTLFRTESDGKAARLLRYFAVYRRLRNFEAAVDNSTSIDRVIESIIDGVFWLGMIFFFLNMEFGLDLWTIFISCSTIIVSFSFALGPSIAATIQGIFTIVMRRPFDIGDRVRIDAPKTQFDSYPDGGWIVENLGLYSTTLKCSSTGEVATISNGSISDARIVNFSRSPNAICIVKIRFAIQTKHETISMFYKTIDLFIKNRPLQWEKLLNFGCHEIEPTLCYIEYMMRVSHVRSWSEYPLVMASKTEMTQYCHDVMQKLQIQYLFPPVALRYDEMERRPNETKQVA